MEEADTSPTESALPLYTTIKPPVSARPLMALTRLSFHGNQFILHFQQTS